MSNETNPLVADSLVSFAGLFARSGIDAIEIPMIQRDYAQGRGTGAVTRIRDHFLDTLCGAVMPGAESVDLDFVFGDVIDGCFFPLDGQQRLTTLFLLHCYLGWRAEYDVASQPWSRFSYATRPGARAFCGFLAATRPNPNAVPSDWICDQAGYLATWEFDPTIQSMLTMLDAIHARCSGLGIADAAQALGRLLSVEQPAIRFHVLPVQANGLNHTLYIKMNSRGKPLTEFENFKAHFESVLKAGDYPQAEEFTKKVDTDWSDLLWDYRGDDNLVDDEFLRLFRCLTEINAWNAAIEFPNDIRDDDLATLVYREDQPDSVEFLFGAIDAWEGRDVEALFDGLLARPGVSSNGRIPLFNAFVDEGVNLFSACCRHYGTGQWTRAHTLLFYGFLVHLRGGAKEPFSQRLRVLRNLIDASGDEIRAGERNNMPVLLSETRWLMEGGALERVNTFNQVQVANEIAKAAMLTGHPELTNALHALEDHDLLRGGLTAFDLDPAHFMRRAMTFASLFSGMSAYTGADEGSRYLPLTGALLACGDYARRSTRGSGHAMCELGAPRNDEPWRTLLRGRRIEQRARILEPLRNLLDATALGQSPPDMIADFLETARKDWRWYFLKYPVMRSGASGRYTISPHGGYSVCMLAKATMASDYYDPYLLAIVAAGGVQAAQISNPKWPTCFTGYETAARELVLHRSKVAVRCVEPGWMVRVPEIDDASRATLAAWLDARGLIAVADGWLWQVAQDDGIDTEDRIVVGGKLLRELVDAGY